MVRGLMFALVCLVAVGCSAKKGEVTVAGRLTRGGKPCEGVGVNLVADDISAQCVIGSTNADGKFEMYSFKGTKGVLPGNYSVGSWRRWGWIAKILMNTTARVLEIISVSRS